MPLPTTGPIAASQINIKLGVSSTDTLLLSAVEPRALAQRPSGQIALSDFRGKSVGPPTYSISPSASFVNEGSSLPFTVSTTNFGSGVLFWTVSATSGTINSSDFTSGLSGTVDITNNSGSITITASADATTEGIEQFVVNLRTGSTSGTIVATSTAVTIDDTSLSPPSWDVWSGASAQMAVAVPVNMQLDTNREAPVNTSAWSTWSGASAQMTVAIAGSMIEFQ